MHVMIVIITKRNMLHKRTNRKKRELGINSHGPAAHALEQLDSKHFGNVSAGQNKLAPLVSIVNQRLIPLWQINAGQDIEDFDVLVLLPTSTVELHLQ